MSWVISSLLFRSFRRVLLLALVLSGLTVLAATPTAFAATIIVTTATDENAANGDCSLREAIIAANTDAATNGCGAGSGADIITFNIPGAAFSTRTIAPTLALGALPAITTPVTVDGWSQGVFDGTAGYNGAPLIELSGVNLTSGTVVAGLHVDGASANGVLIRGLVVNRFTTPGTEGIRIENGASNVTVHGNYVGLNAAGTAAAANNSYGIRVKDATTTNVTIGGTTAAERNVVSGHSSTWGIYVDATGDNITVQGNYAGTNAAGTAAIPNSFGIVTISSGANIVIGGTVVGAGNLISGNGTTGIGVGGTGGARVEGNLVGTNAAGTGLIASAGSGIIIANSSTTATIGGTTAAARNVIVGHVTSGITTGSSIVAHSVSIQGNYVGVMPDGTTAGANAVGVNIAGSTGITVGGTAAGAGNLIANNTSEGVRVTNANTRVLIRGNSIFNNGTTAAHLGIDLNDDGVTANDAGDADTGPNTRLNFPVFTTAVLHSGATRVTGTLNSAANTTYAIDFYANTSCDTSGNGEGQTYLGSTTVTTNGSGDGVFATASLLATTLGQPLTATASNTTNGTTSEFSTCFAVTNPPATLIAVTPTSGLTTTEAGGTAAFTVQLTAAPTSVVTVGVTSSAATEGTVNPMTLTFQPGATGVVAQTVTITGVDDLIQDGAVPYTIVLAAASSADSLYNLVDPLDVSVTNQDNDGTPTLAVTNAQLVEGASGTSVMTFTVTLTPGSLLQVTADYAISGGTAAAGASCGPNVDYVLANGALTFLPTEMSKQVQVTICGDALSEPDETFILTLSNPTNAPIGQATATGTIQNDEGSPALAIADASVAEGNTGVTTLNLPVTLSPASAQTVTVQYVTTNGTATGAASCAAGVDFQQASGTLTFAPGETSKQVSVDVCGDTIVELDEALTVTLSSPTNAALGQATATGTIQDNEGSPSLTIADASVAEADSANATLTFPVTLSPVSAQTVTVQYATANGTATGGAACAAGVDFQQASGALTFAPGETSKQIAVTVCADTADEPSETLTVTLSSPTNALLGQATATGAIQDDDVTQTVSVGAPQLTTNADGTGTATFPINLASASQNGVAGAAIVGSRLGIAATQPVTVSYTTQDGTAKANVDYLPTTGTRTFAPGDTQKTVAVTVLPNGLNNQNGLDFQLVLTSTSNGVIAPGQGQSNVILPAAPVAVKPSTDDTDKPRRETEEQRQQRQMTNRSGRDDTHTEGNVLEVGADAEGAYLVLANRDGPVTVRLQGEAAKTTVRMGDYVQVEGVKESEALFIADDLSVSR